MAGAAEAGASVELDEMKKRLKEMEDEAAALREMQAKVEKEMEEVDSRSVFVGNVDYSCTPEEVQQHFQACGTVNRVTIRTNKFGQPKGYAYVEFLEQEAVQEALLLNESELHGRQLKVIKSTDLIFLPFPHMDTLLKDAPLFFFFLLFVSFSISVSRSP
nr:polyadenylate-binding protein 2-like [Ipomoea batatas]GMD85867.1 polyadenylate-binding protein 2-like [Ipomoea batatas]